MKLLCVLVIASAALTPATSALAYYCSEPDAPSCASSFGSFDDEYTFNSCKNEMENYKSEVEEFGECLRREVNEANDIARKAQSEAEDIASKARREVDQATSEYNDAVSSFNNRAGN